MHPELLRLHILGLERPLYSYGVLLVAAITLGIVVAVARAPRYGVPRFDEMAVGITALTGGLFAGSTLHVAIHLRDFLADPSLWKAPGLVFYGGLFGGAAGAALYCRSWGISLAAAADAAAPGIAFGHAVGRVGCFLGGCCYGRVAPELPFAVKIAGSHRHPVQLYESVALVVLGIVLLVLSKRLRSHQGALFAVYLGVYALVRFSTEHFRGDDFERGFLVPGWLSTSQAIALGAAVAAGLWFFLAGRASSSATCRSRASLTGAKRPDQPDH